MNRGLTVLGVILLLVGALWALQGVGVVGGSFMTGERNWLVIGLATAVVGMALLAWGYRTRRP